jgi:hypothetical protein
MLLDANNCRKEACVCFPQIPQILSDVDCMLKPKFNADFRRYFCFAKIPLRLYEKLSFVRNFRFSVLHDPANFHKVDQRYIADWLPRLVENPFPMQSEKIADGRGTEVAQCFNR